MRSIFGTSWEPSAICLGAAFFGTRICQSDSFAVIDAFVERGGNFLDSAHIYGAWDEDGVGASERTIGEWVRANGGREKIILGTKGGHPPLHDMTNVSCSKEVLDRHLNESLERLRTDYIDIYWLHRDEVARPVGEMIEVLSEFQKDGRIKSYGASNWSIRRIEEANAYAAEHGLAPFVASQVGWSFAEYPSKKMPLEGMVLLDEPSRRRHVALDLPLVAYGSQAHGYFGAENEAWAREGFEGPARRAKEYDSPPNRGRLLRAMEVAKDKDCAANQVGLAYLMSRPFAVYPVIGTSNPAHVREAMIAPTIQLDEEEGARLYG